MRPVYEYRLGVAKPIPDPLPHPDWTLPRRQKAAGWRSRPSAGWASGQVTVELYERDWTGKKPAQPWSAPWDFMVFVKFRRGLGGYRLYTHGVVNALLTVGDLVRLVGGEEPNDDSEAFSFVIAASESDEGGAEPPVASGNRGVWDGGCEDGVGATAGETNRAKQQRQQRQGVNASGRASGRAGGYITCGH